MNTNSHYSETIRTEDTVDRSISKVATKDVFALHSLGLDRNCWKGLADAVGTDWKIHGHDQRGHGKAAEYPPEDFSDFIADARAGMQRLNTHEVHLMGHSLGGAVAASLAATTHYPNIASLTLLATPFEGSPKFSERARASLVGSMQIASGETLARWFGNDTHSPAYQLAADCLSRMNPASYDASWVALGQFPGYNRLHGLLPNTLIISFGDDQSTPPDVGEKIHTTLQNRGIKSRHLVLEGHGHMGLLTATDELSSHLTTHWDFCCPEPTSRKSKS
ncbi:alpha/beta fold hydrolase [Granulosicoccus sp. 3-233]|uniref:alpha/beta fold hydrolase n=1 Tax=Granulosicoccus sp. 3-233 TaxID=3417969 RepID=UPI003D32AA38